MENEKLDIRVEGEQEEPLNQEKVHKMLKSVVLKLGPSVPKEQKKVLMKLLVDIFENGKSPREAMNISDVEIRELYHIGYNLFNSGKYELARGIFHLLNILEPLNPGFATCLGVCYHRVKNYDRAISAYMQSSALEADNPVPLFYCYDCYMNLKMPDAAGIMLCNVIARAGDKPQYAKIKQRASLLLEPLTKELTALNKNQA